MGRRKRGRGVASGGCTEDDEVGTKLIPGGAVAAHELYEESVQQQHRSDRKAWDSVERQLKVIVHV